jgi:hypothetical protein
MAWFGMNPERGFEVVNDELLVEKEILSRL